MHRKIHPQENAAIEKMCQRLHGGDIGTKAPRPGRLGQSHDHYGPSNAAKEVFQVPKSPENVSALRYAASYIIS